MIRRRDFTRLLGGAAAWPLAARAQQRDRVRRIGVLPSGEENDPEVKPRLSAFTQALADSGWTDGRNVRIDPRWPGTDINRSRALARELVGLQPDIILTNGTPATAALRRETRTIPIVFLAGSDPVATGIAGTSPALPATKPRWEASGLNCSRRSRQGSSGPRSCSILTTPPHRFLCPHLRRRPGHSRSCQSVHPFILNPGVVRTYV